MPRDPDAPVKLSVSAAGHAYLFAELAPASLAEPLVLALPRGAVVEGIVRDDSGRPVEGAWVHVRPDHARRKASGAAGTTWPEPLPIGWRYDTDPSGVRALTDAAGRYRIDGVAPWSALLWIDADAEDFESPAARPLTEPIGGPGEVTRVDLVLAQRAPEFELRGLLTLNGTRLRTARGRVDWRGATRSGSEEFRYDEELWLRVEAGRVAVRVHVDGLPDGLDGAEFTVEGRAGERAAHDVALRLPARPISGTVRYPDGAPVPDAAIDASCLLAGDEDDWWDRLHVTAKTGADGTWSVEVPDLGRPWRIEAQLHEEERVRTGVAAGASGVELVLTRPAVLLFRARTEDGGGILSASELELAWKPVDEREFQPLYGDWNLAPDAEGWFELRLPALRIDFLLHDRAYPQRFRSTRVDGIALDPATPQRVELLLRRGLELELRLAPDSAPLPDGHRILLVEDELWPEIGYDAEHNSWIGGALGSTVTRRSLDLREGTATTLHGLAPGLYRFKCFPDDLVIEPQRVEVREGASEPVVVSWREAR